MVVIYIFWEETAYDTECDIQRIRHACFTGIWIESHEQQEALAELAQLCREEAWQLATWDINQGLQGTDDTSIAGSTDPLAAIKAINAFASAEGIAILVLQNFHRFIQSAEIVQALAQQILTGKQNRTFIVVLAPVVSLPAELEKLFVVLEHTLPDWEQLAEIAREIATEPGELPENQELTAVLDAASGLSRFEAEGAFSLSLVREGHISPKAIWELKTQTLKKSGLLTLDRGRDPQLLPAGRTAADSPGPGPAECGSGGGHRCGIHPPTAAMGQWPLSGCRSSRDLSYTGSSKTVLQKPQTPGFCQFHASRKGATC